jgi:hypothetical protein
MNERIKELMAQSIDYACANQKSMDTAMEKFAELIIKECIQFKTVLTQFDGTTPYVDGYENGLRDMAEVIAEHFGVSK